MKRTYLEVGRRLDDQEWQELQNWRKADPRNGFVRGDIRDDGKVFLQYNINAFNGEQWTSEESLSKIRKNKEKYQRDLQDKCNCTTNNPLSINKISLFSAGKILNNSDWEKLCLWKIQNPDLTWKPGDISDHKPEAVFISYCRKAPDGEDWRGKRENRRRSKIVRSKWKERQEHFPTNKVTLFQVERRLTKDEWTLLKSWRKENPDLAWSFGEKHPKYENMCFLRYHHQSCNGEAWTSEEQFSKTKKDIYDHRAKREKEDEFYIFKKKIRNNIRQAFKRRNLIKNDRTEEILGCTIKEFKEFIASKFEPWMTFEKYGNSNGNILRNHRFEIDHIIPISYGNNEEEVILLNHYLNLQPLCAFHNKYVKRDELPPKEIIEEIINSILFAKQKKIVDDMFENIHN